MDWFVHHFVRLLNMVARTEEGIFVMRYGVHRSNSFPIIVYSMNILLDLTQVTLAKPSMCTNKTSPACIFLLLKEFVCNLFQCKVTVLVLLIRLCILLRRYIFLAFRSFISTLCVPTFSPLCARKFVHVSVFKQLYNSLRYSIGYRIPE